MTFGARPWVRRIRLALTVHEIDPQTHQVRAGLRREIRPKELAEIMGISIQKAKTELAKLEEYEKVSLPGGCCVYKLVG